MADAFITRRGGIGGAVPKLQTKTATPTTTQQEVVPDTGYDGLLSVTVNPIPDDYIIPTGTKNITENGTVDVASFAEVNVAVPAPDLSDATVTPAKILLGATAYTGVGKITGTMPTYGGSLRSMPVKGDLIIIENKQYRVLKIDGSVAEVLAMYDANGSIKFDTNSSYGNRYAGKNIDTYCNSTFYNGLSSTMKSAIVDKTFTQDAWQWDERPTASHYYTGKYGSSAYYLRLTNATFGTSITRHCYCISVQDVLDYLETTTTMGIFDTTLTDTNIWKLFWNATTSQSGKHIWLRSASASIYFGVLFVYGDNGSLHNGDVRLAFAARPAFQIDLSKIEFTNIEFTNIEMDRPVVTLATRGTYCENDIRVSAKLQEKTVITNGDVTPDTGYCGLDKVMVNVPATPTQEKTATITENGTTEVTPDDGYDLSKVVITTNVPTLAPNLEEKAVTISENGTTEITPSSGKDGISKVTLTVDVFQASFEEIATAAEMNEKLTAANVGRAYKFIGTTDDTYVNGDLYEVVIA